MSHVDTTTPVDTSTTTPNVVVSNPDIRRYAGVVLYVVAILAGLSSLFFGVFPEVGGDVASRALVFVNAAVSFLSGAFGIVVTLPNVPKTS